LAKSNKLYDALGVDADATEEEIKSAYRSKAKEYHPDSPNGDAEKFHEIKKASVVLLDPVKRKKYDETGDEKDAPDTIEAEALQFVLHLFYTLLSNEDSVEATPVIERILSAISKLQKENNNNIAKSHRSIAKHENLIKRFRKKSAGSNIFEVSLNSAIRNIRENIAALEKKEKVLSIAQTIASDYEFEQEYCSEEELAMRRLTELIEQSDPYTMTDRFKRRR